jgi:hypothetical protein
MLRTFVLLVCIAQCVAVDARTKLPSVGGASASLPQDQLFLDAREAYQAGQIARLNAIAPGLADHPLAPYIAYWQIRSHIDSASEGELRNFFLQNRGGLLADRLRADWLRVTATHTGGPRSKLLRADWT